MAPDLRGCRLDGEVEHLTPGSAGALRAWQDRERFDLVHVHHGFPLGPWAARGLAGRVPLGLTLHGSEVIHGKPWLTAIGAFGSLAAPGEDLAERVRRQLHAAGHEREVSVLPPPLPADIRERAAPAPPVPGRFRIVHVSTGRAIKRVDLVARACLELARRSEERIELHLVGTGPTRVSEAPGFSIRCSPTRPRPFPAEADVLLLASRYESFGLAAQEALASGLPVVAPRVGGLVELVDRPVCGKLVEEGACERPEALAAALQTLLVERFRDPAARAAERGRRMERFGWSTVGPLWEAWVRQAAGAQHDRLPRPQRDRTPA